MHQRERIPSNSGKIIILPVITMCEIVHHMLNQVIQPLPLELRITPRLAPVVIPVMLRPERVPLRESAQPSRADEVVSPIHLGAYRSGLAGEDGFGFEITRIYRSPCK
jgi:hypothetical protein